MKKAQQEQKVGKSEKQETHKELDNHIFTKSLLSYKRENKYLR